MVEGPQQFGAGQWREHGEGRIADRVVLHETRQPFEIAAGVVGVDDELREDLHPQIAGEAQAVLDLGEPGLLAELPEVLLGDRVDSHEQPFQADITPGGDGLAIAQQRVDPAVGEETFANAPFGDHPGQFTHPVAVDERLVVHQEDELLADGGEFVRHRLRGAHVVAAAHQLPQRAEAAPEGTADRGAQQGHRAHPVDEVAAPVGGGDGAVGQRQRVHVERRLRPAQHEAGAARSRPQPADAVGGTAGRQAVEQRGEGQHALAGDHEVHRVVEEVLRQERRVVAADHRTAAGHQVPGLPADGEGGADVHRVGRDTDQFGPERGQLLRQAAGMEARVVDAYLMALRESRGGQVLQGERFRDRPEIPAPFGLGASLRPYQQDAHGRVPPVVVPRAVRRAVAAPAPAGRAGVGGGRSAPPHRCAMRAVAAATRCAPWWTPRCSTASSSSSSCPRAAPRHRCRPVNRAPPAPAPG